MLPASPHERLLTVTLTVLALGCGAWAVWPHLFPGVQAPTVTRTDLPPVLPPVAAPVYPSTASITPLISGRVNLNTASQEQLEALPGIGPALAARLIAARPYRSLDDLDAVKGVGEGLMGKLRDRVSF